MASTAAKSSSSKAGVGPGRRSEDGGRRGVGQRRGPVERALGRNRDLIGGKRGVGEQGVVDVVIPRRGPKERLTGRACTSARRASIFWRASSRSLAVRSSLWRMRSASSAGGALLALADALGDPGDLLADIVDGLGGAAFGAGDALGQPLGDAGDLAAELLQRLAWMESARASRSSTAPAIGRFGATRSTAASAPPRLTGLDPAVERLGNLQHFAAHPLQGAGLHAARRPERGRSSPPGPAPSGRKRVSAGRPAAGGGRRASPRPGRKRSAATPRCFRSPSPQPNLAVGRGPNSWSAGRGSRWW